VLTALSIIGPVIAGIGIVDCLDMPGMESSSEAPSHLRIPICFLPSLAEIIIISDVLIHLQVSPRSVVATLQNIELCVLVEVP
jgi:hypothetical protein